MHLGDYRCAGLRAAPEPDSASDALYVLSAVVTRSSPPPKPVVSVEQRKLAYAHSLGTSRHTYRYLYVKAKSLNA